MGDPPDGDRLSAIFPDFQENPGQSMGLQNGPFLLANRGCRFPKLWVKLMPSGGGMGAMPKMGHPYPRLGFEMGTALDGDRLYVISPDFEENPGQSMGLRNGPILLANRG